jgi:acyl carrier protein
VRPFAAAFENASYALYKPQYIEKDAAMGMSSTENAKNSIEQRIRLYIAENFLFEDAYPYPDEDSFLEKGVVDSTGILELINFTQDTFGITIEDSELLPENLDSVLNLAAFIRMKASAGTP